MSRSSEEILRDALGHFRRVTTYASGDLDNQMAIDAICMRLSAGIEALARLDDNDRDRLFGEDWTEMWGMRNRIAHGYLLVSSDIVRQTISDDIPGIVGAIAQDLGEET